MVPRFPEQSGRVAEASEIIGRQHVLETLYAAGGDRVAVYDLENPAGTPIYVHAKVCVVDDIWLEVGSDNLNRRSWTHDSELSCAMLDTELDDARRPIPPVAATPRAGSPATRAFVCGASTWVVGTPRDDDGDDADLVDLTSGFAAFRAAAVALDAWHRVGLRRAATARSCASPPTEANPAAFTLVGARGASRLRRPGWPPPSTAPARRGLTRRTRYPVGQCGADDTTNVSSGSPPERRLAA